MNDDIEAEIERRLKLALRDHEQAIAEIRRQLLAAEFRAAVAEWAVAGIVGQGVHLRVDTHEVKENRLLDLAHNLSRSTAASMLKMAELAFRDHAALWALRAKVSPTVQYRDAGDPKPPPKESWPLPYRVPR